MTTMTQQARADAGPVSRFAKWAPLAIVLSGTFIFVLDFFVVNVALPSIARDLRASAAAIEWLVSKTIMWWNPFAWTCFSATSVILKTASTLES